jgi:hypothetical protein
LKLQQQQVEETNYQSWDNRWTQKIGTLLVVCCWLVLEEFEAKRELERTFCFVKHTLFSNKDKWQFGRSNFCTYTLLISHEQEVNIGDYCLIRLREECRFTEGHVAIDPLLLALSAIPQVDNDSPLKRNDTINVQIMSLNRGTQSFVRTVEKEMFNSCRKVEL